MDRRERSGELLAGLLALQQAWAGELYVCLPGIVQSFDATKRTCVIQPAIKARVMDEVGGTQWTQMPLLLDCPVVFPGGGDVVITFPLKAGDEVLVHFADRCIDAWWQLGGIQNQAELRMHDLSDGFCTPGPSSIPRVEGGISTTLATMRSRDGVALISLDPAGHEIHVTTTGADVDVKPNEVKTTVGAASVDVTAAQVKLAVGATNATLTNTGIVANCGGTAGITMDSGTLSLTGTVSINGREFLGHHHTDPQGGNTGGVV